MKIPPTLEEIAALSVDERLRLIDAIWDTISDQEVQPDLRDAQKRDLDRRTGELDADPENVLTWEQIKSSIGPARPDAS